MKTFQKWAMAAAAMTAGFGVVTPAMAGISAKDIALIARTCVAIDRGDITEADLSTLNDDEYSALMGACGFVEDGVVSASEMTQFETYYVVFQQDVTSFESVVYSEETTTESHESTTESYESTTESEEVTSESEEVSAETETDEIDEVDEVDEADAGDEVDEVDEVDEADAGDEVDEADSADAGDAGDEADSADS